MSVLGQNKAILQERFRGGNWFSLKGLLQLMNYIPPVWCFMVENISWPVHFGIVRKKFPFVLCLYIYDIYICIHTYAYILYIYIVGIERIIVYNSGRDSIVWPFTSIFHADFLCKSYKNAHISDSSAYISSFTITRLFCQQSRWASVYSPCLASQVPIFW